jgi:ATP-binding cassette subfamily C protein CydD
MNLDRRLFKEFARVRGPLLMALLAGLLAIMVQARQVSRIITAAFLEAQGLQALLPWFWWLLAALAARALFGYLHEISAGVAAQRVKAALRHALAAHLFALGPAYTQGERSGELIHTAAEGVEALDAYFSQYLPQLALAGMLPVAYLIVIFPLDPLSGMALLLTGPLIPFFMFLIGSNAQKRSRRQWTVLGRMSAYFLDTLQGLETLKALGRSREQQERIERVSEQYRDTTLEVLRLTFLSALVLELLGTIGTAIIAVQVGLRLLYGGIQFEEAFFVLLLAPDFYLPLRALGLRFHASMAGVAAARRIYAVLETPLPARAGALPDSAPARTHPPVWIHASAGEGDVVYEDVWYTYPGRSLPALAGVSFALRQGQVTALVGSSGAGKTTVTGLLLRFLTSDRGVIRVEGSPLDAIPLEDWRARIAWLPQQPHLFAATLAENLRIARPGAVVDDLRRAARQAGLLDWVESLPGGWDTPVGEAGARLSGGQAQRLALARAFLRDAPLLVLDEPTAHLDVEQEHLLQQAVWSLQEGRTTLVVAHRISTALQAAHVVVLEGGQVVEQGAPSVLRSAGGPFARLAAVYSGDSA